MTKSQQQKCGCHKECTTQPHWCEKPCIWPDCLSEAEQMELLDEIKKVELDES